MCKANTLAVYSEQVATAEPAAKPVVPQIDKLVDIPCATTFFDATTGTQPMHASSFPASNLAEPTTVLLDVRAVAQLLGCSSRHVYRLADAGRMPSPVKLGSLVRWNRAALEQWITDGCRSVRTVSAKGGQAR